MQDLVEQLGSLLQERKMKIVTGESCTGGLIATTITHKPGASAFFERGFITYSNESKVEVLNVPQQMIDMNGAVSALTAEAMARGAIKRSRADIAISVTGIAGPGGGSQGKPVGLVYLGYAIRDQSAGSKEYRFSGSRKEIQVQAATRGLEFIIETLREHK